jgi:hypothetical protein
MRIDVNALQSARCQSGPGAFLRLRNIAEMPLAKQSSNILVANCGLCHLIAGNSMTLRTGTSTATWTSFLNAWQNAEGSYGKKLRRLVRLK